jgi:hypothetical protein
MKPILKYLKSVLIGSALMLSPLLMFTASAQLYNFTEEQMISFTAKNPYGRFPGAAR